jgi:D-alanine-D-alanine ligase
MPASHAMNPESEEPPQPGATRPLRVAILFNLKESAPPRESGLATDALAELDTPENVQDYAAAIAALGHDVVTWEGGASLPRHLLENPVDICFNTCEGFRGDAREAQVPALLEMLGIPYSGSKVLALALTLDKAMTKRVLAHAGLPTPAFQEFHHPAEPLNPGLAFPLFTKPNCEGTGAGIGTKSVVQTEAELRRRIAYLLDAYQQPVLVEEYIEGRDVTCGLVGNLSPDGGANNLHLFPISEVDHAAYPEGTEPFYSYKLKVELADDYHGLCPAPIPEPVAAEVRRLTVETFRACGCLDMARVDFRLDRRRNLQPVILEINALPGLSRISDLVLCAKAEGWSQTDVLQAIFNAAVDRYLLPRAERGVPCPNYSAPMIAPILENAYATP